MNILESILFGIIQGFSEILPISSSGHLSILGNLFGVSSQGFNFQMLTVFLHFGTMLSIIVVYYPELFEMVNDISLITGVKGTEEKRRRYPSARLMLMLVITCLPLFILIPFIDYIDTLYYSSYFVGAMMIITGVILFISDRLNIGLKDERNITVLDALIIGFCQLVASIPGVSRVALDITACKAVGLSNEFSLKYAYLLSIPVIFGMNIIHFIKAVELGFIWKEVPLYLIGMIISMITGMLAMRIVRKAAERGNYYRFAYYSWVAGVLFIILTMIF